MKRSIAFFISLCVLSSAAVAQSTVNPADKIIGIYWSPKKDAKIEIFKKGDKYFGKSVWSSTRRKDLKNPDESLKKRDLLGVELLTNFTYGDNTYNNGKIYDPNSGKTYDCKISFNGINLKVRGYVGISLFGRTAILERVI